MSFVIYDGTGPSPCSCLANRFPFTVYLEADDIFFKGEQDQHGLDMHLTDDICLIAIFYRNNKSFLLIGIIDSKSVNDVFMLYLLYIVSFVIYIENKRHLLIVIKFFDSTKNALMP